MTVEPDACAVAHGAPDPDADERTLVAVFASPVARYLLSYAADLGYRTVLFEPDAARATDVQTACDIRTVLPGLDKTADVVVTDHHRAELGVVLRDALAGEPRWVGVLGNPRHEGPHVAALTGLGVAPGEIARVHRPVGLNIGSRKPAEIAIAVLAGLLADRNGKPGGFEF
ncbi:XdhC family protein [Amycolatopsis sp. NPDC051903]|uniref:XdhC family protein n=1 Tax=Amycolatopsis sp. NPDC051903 TaxID=3363936 RepID=UPI0037A6035A